MSRLTQSLRSALAIAIVTVLAATSILALSALFAQSDQVLRVAGRAKIIQAVEEVVGAATSTRGATAVALMMAEAHERGYATEEQVFQAAVDVVNTSEEVRTRGEHLDKLVGGSTVTFGPLGAAVADGGGRLAGLLKKGEIGAAGSTVEDLQADLVGLESALARTRADSYALLVAEEGSAGGLVRVTSIAVAFLVPGAALVLFRWLQNRRHRQIELELQLSHEQAQGRIKDQMIAGLSHELRTPLTGIYGMALAMQDEGFHDPEFQAEMTGIIVSQSAELSRMVDDLLVVAKADSGDLSFVADEVDVVREIGEALSPFQHSGREITVSCEPGSVEADRLRLRHVVGNLVSNAVKHGGDRAEILGRQHGDRYRIEVKDNGSGVSDLVRPTMFERYIHDGDDSLTTGSVGLGLAVARLLARGMGGDVGYARHEGITSFVVDLPVAQHSSEELPYSLSSTSPT